MARIPVYQEREAPSGSFRVSELRVPDMNLDAMGKALEGLGRATGQAAQAAIDVETERAKAEAYKAIEDIGLQQEKQLLLMQETDAANGAERFLEKFQGQYDKSIDDYVGQATQPNTIGRKVMVESFRQLRTSLSNRALAFEAETGRLYRRGQYDRAVELAAQRLALDPRQENLDETLGRLQAFRESLRDTPGQKIRQEETTRVTLAKSGLEAIIRERPGEFLAEIEAGKKRGLKTKTGNAFLDLIPADQWDTYINAAKTQLNQKASATRGEFNSRIKNSNAMAADGIPDPTPAKLEDFVAVYGPDDGAEAYSEYEKTQSMAWQISSMKNIPIADIATMIGQSIPTPDSKNYEADKQRFAILQKALKQTMDLRETDAASYVLQNDSTVSEIYQEYERINPFNIDAALSEADRQDLMNRKKQAAERYANATLAEQERLGITNKAILSDANLAQIQQEYLTNQDGEPTADNIMMLASIWGNSWNDIYQQMMREKVLPPMSAIIGSNPNMSKRDAVDMVDASRRNVDTWLTGQPSYTKKDLEESVITNLDDFRKTMIGANGNARMLGGFDTFDTVYKGTMQLAAMYVALGKTTSEAAQLAAERTANNRYSYVESFRVPKQYNAQSVYAGSQIIKNKLTAENFDRFISGLGPDFPLSEYANEVRSNGYWVTNADESGLLLYSPDGSVVKDKDGNDMNFTWDEIIEAGTFTFLQSPQE